MVILFSLQLNSTLILFCFLVNVLINKYFFFVFCVDRNVSTIKHFDKPINVGFRLIQNVQQVRKWIMFINNNIIIFSCSKIIPDHPFFFFFQTIARIGVFRVCINITVNLLYLQCLFLFYYIICRKISY